MTILALSSFQWQRQFCKIYLEVVVLVAMIMLQPATSSGGFGGDLETMAGQGRARWRAGATFAPVSAAADPQTHRAQT